MIFSFGGIGGIGFMLIVNVFDVVILGVFKLDIKFKWNGKEFELCLIVLLLLFYDYCVIDGVVVVRFVVYLKNVLEDLCQLIL